MATLRNKGTVIEPRCARRAARASRVGPHSPMSQSPPRSRRIAMPARTQHTSVMASRGGLARPCSTGPSARPDHRHRRMTDWRRERSHTTATRRPSARGPRRSADPPRPSPGAPRAASQSRRILHRGLPRHRRTMQRRPAVESLTADRLPCPLGNSLQMFIETHLHLVYTIWASDSVGARTAGCSQDWGRPTVCRRRLPRARASRASSKSRHRRSRDWPTAAHGRL